MICTEVSCVHMCSVGMLMLPILMGTRLADCQLNIGNLLQDETPPMPSDITADMRNFLSLCFQKDPAKRPGAQTLLNHRWVQYNRATLRTSWSRTKGLKARGVRTDAHIAVSAAVELMLQVLPAFSSWTSTAGPCSGLVPHYLHVRGAICRCLISGRDALVPICAWSLAICSPV